MILEALASLGLGLLIALASTRWWAVRLPLRRLNLWTGPGAALLGAFVARSVLGPGHPAVVLLAAVAMAAAALSLLVRPQHGRVRSVTA
ncbi:hypothetical protein ACFV3R_13435 [Streptomyces sp. NPDC059740]|uniref:hypothetical protein n=1 Tax=Streptomyces sp. NPDC059740 TaxID=3346926 RepID=UPI00365A4F41